MKGEKHWAGVAYLDLKEGGAVELFNLSRRSRPLFVQRHIANAMGRKIETILLEGVGLSLCSDARGRKIEMLDQGLGLECCGETSYHRSDQRVFK